MTTNSGAKRTVSQHTRADGQKQTANRVGGEFDVKVNGQKMASASDAFDELARQEAAAVRESRIAEQSGMNMVSQHELDQIEDRTSVSGGMTRLYDAHPEVAEWRAQVEADGTLSLQGVFDRDGRISKPRKTHLDAWRSVGASHLPKRGLLHDDPIGFRISEDGSDVEMHDFRTSTGWRTEDPAGAFGVGSPGGKSPKPSAQEVTQHQLGELMKAEHRMNELRAKAAARIARELHPDAKEVLIALDFEDDYAFAGIRSKDGSVLSRDELEREHGRGFSDAIDQAVRGLPNDSPEQITYVGDGSYSGGEVEAAEHGYSYVLDVDEVFVGEG